MSDMEDNTGDEKNHKKSGLRGVQDKGIAKVKSKKTSSTTGQEKNKKRAFGVGG